MKEKNRFSVLLEHLTSMANLKNYVLAKAVQYDESYISKWINGKSLPTEKNHEIILQNISQCIVEALTDDNRDTFLEEYQISDVSNLQKAIYDHLESEYTYVKELQVTTGSKVATKISYYPELTLDQFIFKMKHPSLRKVQSLNIYAMVDILNVDTNYQLLIAEFNSMHNDRGLVLPGVHFSLMIDLESSSDNPVYTAGFLMNLLSNLSNIDFNLYCGTQAQKKMVFAIKDIYSLSGMLVDQNHCLAVTPIRALIYASAFTDFTVTGELDFYGYRIQLSPEQRLHFFKHMKHLHEISNALQIKILPNGLLSDYQHIPRPTLFFADEFSYLRFRRNTPYYNICIPNKISLNRIFSAFYDTVWEFESCIAPDAYLTHAIHSVEILQSDASGDVHN